MTCIVPCQTKDSVSQLVVVAYACNTITQAPRELRQRGYNIKLSLCYIGRSCLKKKNQ